MKVELVNCMYEHVFSQSLLYYCISESFYKVPGELFKIMIIIIKKRKRVGKIRANLSYSIPGLMLKTRNRWYFPCYLNLVIEHLYGYGRFCLALLTYISFIGL